MSPVRVQHGGCPLSSPDPYSMPGGEIRPCARVETIASAQFNRWNDLVRQFPHAGFFHGSGWMEVLQAAYAFRPVGLAFWWGDDLVGLVPMTEVLSRWTGRRGVSLPFADVCPPLIPAQGDVTLLLPALMGFARDQGWDYFEIRGSVRGAVAVQSGAGQCPESGLKNYVPSVRFHGHRIELPRDPAELWARLKGPVRTGIRKAQSAGVVIESSTSIETLRQFYTLYRQTRQRHGLPPQPWAFFEAIHDRILAKGQGRVLLARGGDQCLAGAVFFEHGRSALFKYGAFDARHQRLRANNQVFWSALTHYVEAGFETVDLGRTSLDNIGLRRFKGGWASAEYALEYTKYELPGNRFVTDKDRAVGWHNWLFRLAPRWASGLAGKLLYKHWA